MIDYERETEKEKRNRPPVLDCRRAERVADPGRYLVGRKRYVHVGSLLVGIPRIAGVTASRQ